MSAIHERFSGLFVPHVTPFHDDGSLDLESLARLTRYFAGIRNVAGLVSCARIGESPVLSLEEKPQAPKSSFAIPGIYFYDGQVVEIAENLKPSPRGEIEITDLNKVYLQKGRLKAKVFSRGVAWLDAGTHESLLQASMFIEAIQQRQSLMISCPEEIAYRMGYITKQQLCELGKELAGNSYGEYVLTLANQV